MSANTIRLGIIGTGLAVEQLHWPAITELGDRYVVNAFCDTDRSHAEHFADYAGASMDNFTPDYEKLLARDDLDAILISLPIPDQARALVAALESGKHVICEKPPAATENELRGLVPVVEAHPDQVLLIGENYFYQDTNRFARKLLDDGALGRIHSMSFRRVKQLIPREGDFSSTPWRWQGNYTGGAHLDGGVHQVAAVRMLMGDVKHLNAETQHANATHHGPTSLTVNMRFVSEAIGNLTLGNPEFPTPPDGDDMRIYGMDGVMSVGDNAVTVWRRDETTTYSFPKMDGGYVGEFQNFHEAVTMGAPVIGTFAESYRGMEIITRAVKSSDEGTVEWLDDSPTPLTSRPVDIWLPAGADALDLGEQAKTSAGLGDRT